MGIKPLGKEVNYMQFLDLILYNFDIYSDILTWYEYTRLGYSGLSMVTSIMLLNCIWGGFFEYNYFLTMSILGKN